MLARFASAAATLAVCAAPFTGRASPAMADDPSPLRLVKSIPLPGIEKRIDHFAIDAAGKRMVLAALGSDVVVVIDLEKGEVVHTIDGQGEPQGVAILPDTGRIVVANGDDGTVRFYVGATFEIANTIELGNDADNARLDAATGRLYVGYGKGAIAIVETSEKKIKHLLDVRLKAHPEAFALEAKGPRIFVNVPEAGHVAVIDREKQEVTNTWPVKEAHGNFPMCLDEENHRLFVGCRAPAKMLVFDTTTGKVVTSIEISGDVDDVWLDGPAKRLFLSCGEGFVDVVAQKDADHYERTTKVPTASRARTSFFVPATGRLYVAVPHEGEQRAEVRVYETRAK